jgi:hypothetical protein
VQARDDKTATFDETCSNDSTCPRERGIARRGDGIGGVAVR